MREVNSETDTTLQIESLNDLVAGPQSEHFERLLISFLQRQRWFGSKSRTIESVKVLDHADLPKLGAAILFVLLIFEDRGTEMYQLALSISSGEKAAMICADRPSNIVAEVGFAGKRAVLHDAVADEDFRQTILQLIETNGELPTRHGVLRSHRSDAFAAMGAVNAMPSRLGSAEQSNTSIIYGGSLILKLFRRMQTGENPDTEIGRFLTDDAHFPRIAPFLGDITLVAGNGELTTVAMLQGLVANEGDGWQWTMKALARYFQAAAALAAPVDVGYPASLVDPRPSPQAIREYAAGYLDAAALLGTRTAEMHLALATSTENHAFAAESFNRSDLSSDSRRIESQLTTAFDALTRGISKLAPGDARSATIVLNRRQELLSWVSSITERDFFDFGQRIRIHGDYHLGQVLRSQEDFVILDFEGEPARSLAERQAKQSPLKDVAGMLRSFSYAAYAALKAFVERGEGDARSLERWATAWQNAVSTEFLRAYNDSVRAKNPDLFPRQFEAQHLLNAYLLEKALYELQYELNNRPAWVSIPMAGILAIHP